MSRLIKKPIAITDGATLTQSGDVLTIKGPKGELKITIPRGVALKNEGENFWVSTSRRPSEDDGDSGNVRGH